MKKKICIALAAVLVWMMASAAVLAAAEKKTGTAVKGTPVIDGEMDEVWSSTVEYTDYVQTGANVTGVETNIKPSLRILWDENYLYFFTKVIDENVGGTAKVEKDLCNNDSFEIMIDQRNEKTFGAYLEDDIWLKVDYTGTYTKPGENGGRNVPEGVKTAAKVVNDGYIIELAIPWTHIKPEAGMTIGFDCSWSDNTAGGDKRTTWIHWHESTEASYMSPKGMDNLVLVESIEESNPASSAPADSVATEATTAATEATTAATEATTAATEATEATTAAIEATTVATETQPAPESKAESTTVETEAASEASGENVKEGGISPMIFIGVGLVVVIGLVLIFGKKILSRK